MLLRRHKVKAASKTVVKDVVKEPETKTGSFNYNKTEINRMPTADLQKLAAEYGIENAEKISGADLKKLLIEKFGL